MLTLAQSAAVRGSAGEPLPVVWKALNDKGTNFLRGQLVLVAAGPGCIAGDAEIVVNRGGNGTRLRLEQLVPLFNGEEIPLGLGGYLDVGLLDTMKDLAVNFVGAVVFSFVGYFYVKGRGKGWFAKRFIPKVVEQVEKISDPKKE